MFLNKELVIFGYFALSVMFMSVALLAIYRILRFPSRFLARFQSERSRKHAISGTPVIVMKYHFIYNETWTLHCYIYNNINFPGCLFSILFILRVTSKAMSPFWMFTLSTMYGVFILMAISGLYKVSIRYQWGILQRRIRYVD